jgi:hypothetical protein
MAEIRTLYLPNMKQDRNIGLKLRTNYMDREFIHNLKII